MLLSNSFKTSPFLKAKSEPRFWLSSKGTDGSSSSSKSQFLDRGSSSELIGTTFTIVRTWNFYKCLKLPQFLEGNFFFELFVYFLEFYGFTFHFRPFQAKKIFSKNFHYEFTLFICGFVVDQFFWEPPGRFLLTERENHRFLRELWCWLFLPTRSWEPSHRKGLFSSEN